MSSEVKNYQNNSEIMSNLREQEKPETRPNQTQQQHRDEKKTLGSSLGRDSNMCLFVIDRDQKSLRQISTALTTNRKPQRGGQYTTTTETYQFTPQVADQLTADNLQKGKSE